MVAIPLGCDERLSTDCGRAFDGSDISLKPFPQLICTRLIGDEGGEIVRELIVGKGFQPWGRWHVTSRRPCAHLALLLFFEKPGDIELRCVWMRSIFEDRCRLRPDR